MKLTFDLEKSNLEPGSDTAISSGQVSENFANIIRKEIESLDPAALPLQQGLSQGSHVSDESFSATIITIAPNKSSIVVKTGIFYSSIIAGCNCADDPTPVDTLQEYCVLEFEIDKATGEANVELITE